MWGTEICGDLNYFSFLITQYVNIFLPCKILKHYLISYDCIQLQAIKNQHLLKQMGVYFSRGTRRNLEAGSMKVQWRENYMTLYPRLQDSSCCLKAHETGWGRVHRLGNVRLWRNAPLPRSLQLTGQSLRWPLLTTRELREGSILAGQSHSKQNQGSISVLVRTH